MLYYILWLLELIKLITLNITMSPNACNYRFNIDLILVITC